MRTNHCYVNNVLRGTKFLLLLICKYLKRYKILSFGLKQHYHWFNYIIVTYINITHIEGHQNDTWLIFSLVAATQGGGVYIDSSGQNE